MKKDIGLEAHKMIVFGAEHYNPLGIVRSLGEAGYLVDAIVIKSETKILSKSKYIAKLHMVDSVSAGYELLRQVYGKESCPPFVFTADDGTTSYLDMHYEELKEKFIFYNAGAIGRITEFMDKYSINNLAKKHGLNVLDNVVTDLGVVPEGIEYPIITKSISSNSGGWKDDVYVCHNRSELEEAFTKIKSERVLIQKYIKKKNELCLDGFVANKGNDLFVSIASTYDYILPSTYSSYMTIKNFDNQKLFQQLNEMFKEVGFEGIFSVEFLVDEKDELYFLEINFRNSTWSYASTCLDMNLPLNWAKSMLGKVDEKEFYKKIPENYKAMVEISDFKARVIGRRISLFQWIKEVKNAQCKFYYNKKDLKPFIYALLGKLFH